MTRPSPKAQALLGVTLLLPAWAMAAQAQSQATSKPSTPATALPFRPTTAPTELPSTGQWLMVVMVLLVVLAAALALLKGFGHRLTIGVLAKSSKDRCVELVERTPLPPHGQLVVVDYGARRLLLAVGPAHTVCVRDDPREEAAA